MHANMQKTAIKLQVRDKSHTIRHSGISHKMAIKHEYITQIVTKTARARPS